jgi:hypothetical protein
MLGQAQITTTASTVYTVPASTTTIIKEINVANRGQIATPSSGATLAASTTGGTIATGTVYVKYTYVDSLGNETAASAETSVAVTGPTASVTVTGATLPVGAVGIKVYASSSTGTQKLAGTSAAGSNVYTLTSIPGAGASPPSSNTTGQTTPVTVYLFAVPSGGSPDFSNLIVKWAVDDASLFKDVYSMVLTAGKTIQARASAVGCTVTVSGVEIA